MSLFRKLFSSEFSVIGMVHLAALPGTPKYDSRSVQKIIVKACKETEIYLNNEVNGILVENMHDIPYVQSKDLGPETTAIMTRVCSELRRIVPHNVPCGVQVLAGGNQQALAIAHACSFNFIRAEGFVFSHIADEGFTDANAGSLLRYRKTINADDIMVFTDIKKKHSSHAITSDVSLIETAKAAEFFMSDGIILTGAATGSPADVRELEELKANISLPVIIGSGVTRENLHKYVKADALIIGSYFKDQGHWQNDVSNEQVHIFMDYAQQLI